MALVLTSGLAFAPSNAGFYLGMRLGGAIPNHGGHFLADFMGMGMETESGFGLEALLGCNFTDNFGIGVQGGAASGKAVEDWDWLQSYAVLSGRFSPPLKEKIVPYV